MPAPASHDRDAAIRASLIAIAPDTHYELYHDWRKALAFCRSLPDASPPERVTFHMFWRQRRRGLLRKARPFGRKQALPVKAFFATQDLSQCTLALWSDEDISGNPWLRPFARQISFRVYEPDAEVRGTPLDERPALFRQQDAKVYRDGDLFRILVLHNYGGVYVDMDMVLLRSLGALLGQEFIYQWEGFDGMYNGAIMHVRKASHFARELIDGVIEIPPGEFNWSRGVLRRAVDHGAAVTIFPSPFFNTEWQADPSFHPFRKQPASVNLYEGAFAWHWHNRWDDPIEPGSKFQLLEERADAKLVELGFPAGPPVRAGR